MADPTTPTAEEVKKRASNKMEPEMAAAIAKIAVLVEPSDFQKGLAHIWETDTTKYLNQNLKRLPQDLEEGILNTLPKKEGRNPFAFSALSGHMDYAVELKIKDGASVESFVEPLTTIARGRMSKEEIRTTLSHMKDGTITKQENKNLDDTIKEGIADSVFQRPERTPATAASAPAALPARK